MLPLDPARYALFCGVMAVFAISPGPANLFMIATGVREGPRGVALGVAGLNTGSLVWIGAAALGLGALAAAFPLLFSAMAVAGAAYVAWLGLKSIWAAVAGNSAAFRAIKPSAAGAAFRDGVAVQIANPKAVVFFSAVLPPFVDPARPALAQFALLGATTLLMDVIAMSGCGLAGGVLSAALRKRGPRRLFSALTGALLVIAALLIVMRLLK